MVQNNGRDRFFATWSIHGIVNTSRASFLRMSSKVDILYDLATDSFLELGSSLQLQYTVNADICLIGSHFRGDGQIYLACIDRVSGRLDVK